MPVTYRQAAAVFLLRHVPQRGEEAFPYQILLVHKPRKRDAWQLPQGGIERGETLTEAALRELQEEASVTGVTVLSASNTVYQYEFPPSYRRFRPDAIGGQRIGFIIGMAPPDAVVVVDGKEIDAFEWVFPKDVGRFIRRQAYLKIVMELCEEARGKVKKM
jgi:8-oxo-dGTP pyrophosphatase MutT (NUDIX family)